MFGVREMELELDAVGRVERKSARLWNRFSSRFILYHRVNQIIKEVIKSASRFRGTVASMLQH